MAFREQSTLGAQFAGSRSGCMSVCLCVVRTLRPAAEICGREAQDGEAVATAASPTHCPTSYP